MEKRSNLDEMVALLAKKVSLLSERNKKLLQDNKQLRYKIDRLTQERAEQQEEVSILTQNIEASNLANNFVASYGNKRAATKAIKNILREIDDCIVLINK